MNISITIPAHNEQGRIGKTLDAYHEFFSKKADENKDFSYEFADLHIYHSKSMFYGFQQHPINAKKYRVEMRGSPFTTTEN